MGKYGSVEILKHSTYLKYWVSEKDKGQTDAVNKGIKATDGEIIGWLNSDDIYYPGTLAFVLDFFVANPDIDVLYGMADHIDVNDQAFEAYPTEAWNFERLKETCFICQPALFFRRRLIEQQGLLDETLTYCMDYEYWLRLAKAGVQFAYIEKKFAGSRLYADTKTLSAKVKVHREINDMFKKKFGKVPDRWLFNYAHASVEAKINREKYPRRFLYSLLTSSLWSTFYWNKKISTNFLNTLGRWFYRSINSPKIS